jgi:hypothetical protein
MPGIVHQAGWAKVLLPAYCLRSGLNPAQESLWRRYWRRLAARREQRIAISSVCAGVWASTTPAEHCALKEYYLRLATKDTTETEEHVTLARTYGGRRIG